MGERQPHQLPNSAPICCTWNTFIRAAEDVIWRDDRGSSKSCTSPIAHREGTESTIEATAGIRVFDDNPREGEADSEGQREMGGLVSLDELGWIRERDGSAAVQRRGVLGKLSGRTIVTVQFEQQYRLLELPN